MIKKIEFEPGYTPSNLRLVVEELQSTGMTQQQIAESIGAARYTTLANWMSEHDQPRHRNMPADKWKNILELFHSKHLP
ncbi:MULTISPECIES: hypothetical protein [Acinetobacter]|uniref:XRE family transcriptional regulator n=1 Tax=Acinetobacter higginsii TaxID=70347 RepID=N9SVT4_9GAMM|nr:MULTISPECIES: hypothetical protein [Acinetobacter]ENX58811.1 hypothetical protein F902_01438 [Acinetobacter higginsii]